MNLRLVLLIRRGLGYTVHGNRYNAKRNAAPLDSPFCSRYSVNIAWHYPDFIELLTCEENYFQLDSAEGKRSTFPLQETGYCFIVVASLLPHVHSPVPTIVGTVHISSVARSGLTTASSPCFAANFSGVHPAKCLASGSNLTTPSLPLDAASISGVHAPQYLASGSMYSVASSSLTTASFPRFSAFRGGEKLPSDGDFS